MDAMSKVMDSKGRYVMLAIGLFLILVANTFEWTVLKVRMDELLANIGGMIAVIGLLQSVFDTAIRHQLVTEIYSSVTKGSRIRESGIVDAVLNSRDVDYRQFLATARRVVIGTHYSPSFFEDYIDQFKQRSRSKQETTILVIKPEGGAAKYLVDSKSTHSNVKEELEKLRRVLPPTEAKYLSHDRVLRYSFVLADDDIWVRFFTNSEGFSHVPALHVRRGGVLFNFFEADIARLAEQSHE